ncbi:MAG: peptidase M48 [Alteromonadaceae bacterium]|nr:peptidase M48 [Alteromonadaceae bacterium]MBH86126.1 peptidase M48 [Alteromonadaceae bacterium]|tara:strand:+ start:1794 stop:3287 length:1494 start_codon:yes stop_codon:yes gene_type:complete
MRHASPYRKKTRKYITRVLHFSASLLFGLATALPLQAADTDLPSLGGVGGGLISEQQEAAIGRQVMQSLRRSTQQIEDPLVVDYLGSMVYRLVPYAPLQNRDLSLVVIDSPEINAFAVPGGIIGVNGGLFLNANTEQQFASVLAHELAHLSQRHFARRLEQQQTSTPMTIAGMLAGIILSAVTKSDVGIAAIAGTQALAIQNMLQYSRSNEQEADRVGIDIMADAGLDPHGMPEMFEIMMRQNRLQGGQPPEYLSTHPLTQSRVSDSRSRANQYPVKKNGDELEYHLVRARLQVHYAQSAEQAAESLQAMLDSNTSGTPDAAIRYGVAVANLEAGKIEAAQSIIEALLRENPGRITYQVTLADVLTKRKQYDQAIELMSKALSRNPRNYPITYALATAHYEAGNGRQAAELFGQLTQRFPSYVNLWLNLSDAEGLARDIVGVHRARAEYDILMGDLEAAGRQLREALNKVPPGTPVREIVTQRLTQVTKALEQQRQQ